MGRQKSGWPESWDQLLRYRLIEIIALWEGRLTTNHLQKAFGIGRQQASQNIQSYIEQKAPGSLVYCKFLKGYKPSPTFEPRYTRGMADEYLHLLVHQKHLTDCFAALDVRLPNTETIAPPARIVRPVVLQKVTRACREKLRLEMEYASMNNPVPETRVIQPHTLVYNGYRWHVRAWCEKNKAFRDFLLTRIFNEPELLTAADQNPQSDVAWQKQVTLEIIAEINRVVMRKLQRYSVTVYEHEFRKLRDIGAIEQVQPDLWSVVRGNNAYDDDRGLLMAGEQVVIDDALRAATVAAISGAREILAAGKTPPPTSNKSRCKACSLVDLCEPETFGRDRSAKYVEEMFIHDN